MTHQMTALDAAEIVLEKARQPMTPEAIWVVMTLMGLWASPAGQTPWKTLGAALYRDVKRKGANSRFEKVGSGEFARRR